MVINQELLNYINQQLIYGEKIEKIKEILLEAGWYENDINGALNEATNFFREAPPLQPKSSNKKFIFLGSLICFLLITGAVAGYFYYNQNKNIISSISILPSPIISPTLAPSPSYTPTITPTPTPSRTPVPTKKPTPTQTHIIIPTPTPTQTKQKILEKFATMVYDGPIYNQGAPDGYRVSRKFYETHPDVYDFIVVYSAIPIGMQSANGLTVKNGIRGNGSFFPDQDDTAKYGSNGKLLGYIYVPTGLGLDANANIDLLDILEHEVGHHWLMFIGDSAACKDNPNSSIKCSKTPTGFRVSRDGAHWSSNVDTAVREGGLSFKDPISDGFNFYWQMNANGYCSTVPVTGSGSRFNDIDLFLMGFMSPNEAKPIYWYDLGDTSDKGTKCTQHTISAQDIINMEGSRQPAYPTAQRNFKIGFILLTAPGQSATQQQISRMNYIIDSFPAAWHDATRKTSTINIPL